MTDKQINIDTANKIIYQQVHTLNKDLLSSAKAVCNDNTKQLLQQIHCAYVDANKKYNHSPHIKM